MCNSGCHHGSKVASKLERHHVSGLPHPPYSSSRSFCDFWFLEIGMLKGVLKDHGFNLGDEIEEAITKV
jgi:hypothetical protein